MGGNVVSQVMEFAACAEAAKALGLFWLLRSEPAPNPRGAP
jgi:hypothetical protein